MKLKHTVGKDVMSIRGPLDLAFSIEAVKDVLNLDLSLVYRSTRSSHLPALALEFLFFQFLHEQIECDIFGTHSIYQARQDTCNNH